MAEDNNTIINRTRDFLGQKEVKYFIGGIIVAYAIKKISETEFAHNLAVDTTAEYLSIKDSIDESIENIKEDANDIHKEAMKQRKQEIFEIDNEDIYEDNEKLEEEWLKKEYVHRI